MPRNPLTPMQRALNVQTAVDDLPRLVAEAIRATQTHPADHPYVLRCWEAVEINGATVHRQARLLAGKSRGG